MRVKLLLTPSARIDGLPDPIPKEGETVDLADDVAKRLVAANIAVPVQGKRKVTGQAKKPTVAETKPVEIAGTIEPDKKKES